MAEFLYTVRAIREGMVAEGATEEEAAILEQHGAYLARLAREGVVELAGRTQNPDATSFGLVVFKAEDEDAALDIMTKDPAVLGGVMRAELFPYRVAYRSAAAED